ncbi:MAG: sigma-70 family RNA polymerase sigma factor [Planctomycetota bacterium]|nr:sigma-70 family RNA polymerase sigma factor [Planctomycetota bacterium]
MNEIAPADIWERQRREILTAMRCGEEKPLRAFYDEHFPAVYRFVLCRVDERHADAEEIVEETFYQAFRDMAAYDPSRSSPRAWLMGIARHRLLDFQRRSAAAPMPMKSEDLMPALSRLEDDLLPESQLERRETRLLIEQALSDLPEDYEKILRLRFIDGMAVKDIADRLGISFKAAEAKLFRARQEFCRIFRAASSASQAL